MSKVLSYLDLDPSSKYSVLTKFESNNSKRSSSNPRFNSHTLRFPAGVCLIKIFDDIDSKGVFHEAGCDGKDELKTEEERSESEYNSDPDSEDEKVPVPGIDTPSPVDRE